MSDSFRSVPFRGGSRAAWNDPGIPHGLVTHVFFLPACPGLCPEWLNIMIVVLYADAQTIAINILPTLLPRTEHALA